MKNQFSFPRWLRVLCASLMILYPLLTVMILVERDTFFEIQCWDAEFRQLMQEQGAWHKSHNYSQNMPPALAKQYATRYKQLRITFG